MMNVIAQAIGKPFVPDFSTPGYALTPFLPEILLAIAVIVVLVVPFFSIKRSNVISGVITGCMLCVALFLRLLLPHSTGPWLRDMLVVDSAGEFWKSILYVFSIGIVLMWFGSTRSTLHEGDGPEFFTLFLTSIIGMSLMGQTSNLLLIVLSSEIASMPSYILAGFRKTHKPGSEAALKYVLIGAVTTGVMIYGMSLLYGVHGTLHLAGIGQQMQVNGVDMVSVIGLICVLVGILFKLSAVPVHFWCPDVFEGAHIDIAAFLSVASKGAGLILLARMVLLLENTSLAMPIAITLGLIGAITTTVGNLGALSQTSVKRLLAYSSISHAGYMLCILAMAHHEYTFSALTTLGIYLAIYLVMNLGAFTVAARVDSLTQTDRIEDYYGLSTRSPWLAISMTICLLSMIGLPPAAGIIAKWKMLQIVISAGGYWWILGGVIALNSVFSVYYYAKIIRAMYLSSGTDKILPTISPGIFTGILAIGCAVVLVGMLVFFGQLEGYASSLAGFWRPSIPTVR